MKYIRTKDGIVDLSYYKEEGKVNGGIRFVRITNGGLFFIQEKDIIKQADTIEELCDKFVRVCQPNTKNEWHFVLDSKESQFFIGNKHIDYGAIWTNKGLIYVAKMNDKGELELL